MKRLLFISIVLVSCTDTEMEQTAANFCRAEAHRYNCILGIKSFRSVRQMRESALDKCEKEVNELHKNMEKEYYQNAESYAAFQRYHKGIKEKLQTNKQLWEEKFNHCKKMGQLDKLKANQKALADQIMDCYAGVWREISQSIFLCPF